MSEAERDIGVCKGGILDNRIDMAELGLPRLQEFLSCRRIEEEILHKNRGAVRRSDIGDIQNIAALNDNLRSRGRISRIT